MSTIDGRWWLGKWRIIMDGCRGYVDLESFWKFRCLFYFILMGNPRLRGICEEYVISVCWFFVYPVWLPDVKKFMRFQNDVFKSRCIPASFDWDEQSWKWLAEVTHVLFVLGESGPLGSWTHQGDVPGGITTQPCSITQNDWPIILRISYVLMLPLLCGYIDI